MKVVSITLLVFLTVAYYGKCSKILVVYPAPARSHYILGSTLAKALAEKGHDVTIISCHGEKDPPKNGSYRDIIVTGVKDKINEMQKENGKEINMFDREGTNPFVMNAFLNIMMPQFMALTFENEEVQKLIKSKEKFDVVIVEQFLNEAQKALAAHFEAPLITMSTVGPNLWVNNLVANPTPLSYIPDVILNYRVPMTFLQRVVNTLLYLFTQAMNHLYVFPGQNNLIKKYIPNGPDLDDVLYNSSLVLLNSHPSFSQAVPQVPCMVEIGGFHVKPPKKLPQDLQEFLDDAKDGVIYFSMGSNLKSADFPAEKRDAFLNAFSKLKQKVLWKWEDDVLPGQPKNVKLSKWLPQQDILAHPNVKLFITHGGMLSTTETVYHGVPILAIPVFGDQHLNAQFAVNNGYGLLLPYSQISEEKLMQNLNEILNNPKYRNNAKQRSEMFHDRLVPPMDTAIYWIEYVIRHKGAPHLRVAGLDLPWYKYHLLDVIGFLVVAGFTLLLISYYFTKTICRKLCSRTKSKKVKSS